MGEREIVANRIAALARGAWRVGFPPGSGTYLVELEDGEMVVTPWSDGTRYIEIDGEYERRGWTCLTNSRATVQRWCHVRDARTAIESYSIEETRGEDDV